MDKIVSISNTHEGRDKFCKAFQYLFKIILSNTNDKETINKIAPAFNLLRDARKIFRLAKGMNEFKYIINKISNDMCFKASNKDLIDIASNVTSILKMMMDLDELYKQKLYSDKSSKEANLKLDKAIFNTYLNIIGKIGDCFPSSQGCNIPQRFIGRPWSETTVGIGGLISALVALKNTWK